MRISEREKTAIVDAVTAVDSNATVWLFGSRTDDEKKGGDIDIAVLSKIIGGNVMKQIEVRRLIYSKIGEQKIDIVVSDNGSDVFFALTVEEGIRLN